jgi:hypothetical protein
MRAMFMLHSDWSVIFTMTIPNYFPIGHGIQNLEGV